MQCTAGAPHAGHSSSAAQGLCCTSSVLTCAPLAGSASGDTTAQQCCSTPLTLPPQLPLLLQAALRSKRQGRTTLIVAHRLSTIADADQIVVLAAGRVAEVGSHAQLLAAGGLYQQLWSRQLKVGEEGGEGEEGQGEQQGQQQGQQGAGSRAAAPEVSASSSSSKAGRGKPRH